MGDVRAGCSGGWPWIASALMALVQAGCLKAPASPGSEDGGPDIDGAAVAQPFTPVTAIAGQLYTYCAVGTLGRVACWGDTEFLHYQPVSTREPNSPVPTLIVDESGSPLTDAVEVRVGATAACARLQNGTMWCWGHNDSGELGQGEKDEAGPYPARRAFTFDRVTAIAVGAGHACAVEDSQLYCWGRDSLGQVGNGGELGDPTVVGATNVSSPVTQVAAGNNFTCMTEESIGELHCTGEGTSGQTGSSQSTTMFVQMVFDEVRAMSLAVEHGCAFTANGKVACWGSNLSGELGRGSQTDSEPEPQELALPGSCLSVTDVATGGQSSCMICDGKAYCWGAGGGGRLGIGSSPSAVPEPTAVASLPTATDVAMGNVGGCALRDDGQVMCWGSNQYSALGVGLTEADLSERIAPQAPVAFDQMELD